MKLAASATEIPLSSRMESLSAICEASIERGKNLCSEWRAGVRDSTLKTAVALDRCVRRHPWNAVSGAAFIGLVLGFWFSRR